MSRSTATLTRVDWIYFKTTTDPENQHQKINSAKIVYSHNFLSAFIRGLFVEPHSVSLMLTCFFISSTWALLWSISNGDSFIQLILVFVVVGYFGGDVEAFRSQTKAYVYNQKDLTDASEYIQKIRNTNPAIIETVHCFHYESRIRTVPYTETTRSSVYRNGQCTTEYVYTTKYRTETYQELVARHRGSKCILYEVCQDNSVVPDLSTYSICKLTTTKSWAPTTGSQDTYNEVVRSFKAEHAHCDTHRTFGTEFDIIGFHDSLLTYTTEKDVPFVVRYGAYLFPIFALLGMSWFYRIYLSGICGAQTFEARKEVQVLGA